MLLGLKHYLQYHHTRTTKIRFYSTGHAVQHNPKPREPNANVLLFVRYVWTGILNTNKYKRFCREAKDNCVCVIKNGEHDFNSSVSVTNDISSLMCSRLWCGMCPSPITPVHSVLWSQNQEGRRVCVWLIGVWVLWGARMGCLLLPPTIASDPGGQLSCDAGLLPASFSRSPHLVPWAQSRCRVGAAATPAPRPRLKAPGLILNLLALAFS